MLTFTISAPSADASPNVARPVKPRPPPRGAPHDAQLHFRGAVDAAGPVDGANGRAAHEVLGNRFAIPTGSTALLLTLLIRKGDSQILRRPEWPVFNRSPLAAFQRSVTIAYPYAPLEKYAVYALCQFTGSVDR